MAIKKKKYRNTSIGRIIKEHNDKHYALIYKNAYVIKYKELFETLPQREYLSRIFFNPKFILYWSFLMRVSYQLTQRKLETVYSNFNENDLYIYLKLNHDLNKDKDERHYMYSIYNVIDSLYTGYEQPLEVRNIINQEQCLVYGFSNYYKKPLVNAARDFYKYDFSLYDLKMKYGYRSNEYIEKLKEIYQLDLCPIDISQNLIKL